jgi:2-polyprenyl-6-methoxyphenol hydroxylase-like FAD-dependent oxidoreductase
MSGKIRRARGAFYNLRKMASRFDVCIRGGGAVGMSLALALSRQGLAVAWQALPRPSGAQDVRTYALNARAVELLTALKVWEALPSDARTPVHDMRIQGDAPGAVLRFSAYEQSLETLAWIVDAGELEAVLERALGFAPHVERVAFDIPVEAALLAVCDGRDSASRAALGVQVDTRAYGHRAVAARLVADEPHAGLAWQWFRSPDVLALLPFDRPERGRSYGLVWSLPEALAGDMLALDDSAFEHALVEATGGAAGALRLASQRSSWPLMLTRCEPVCGPGWALLGDAAHVVHPLAGQGLNLGLADVEALARVVAQREPWRSLGDEKLLGRYARERWLPTRAMGGLTDTLMHLFAHEAPTVRTLRNAGLRAVQAAGPLKRLLTTRALRS